MSDGIDLLLGEVSVIAKEDTAKKKKLREEGKGFNVHSVCRMQYDELKHSRMIAELLNPDGAHGQNDAYLKEFIKVLVHCSHKKGLKDFSFKKTHGVKVKCESKYVDISLENDTDIIIIENKLKAKDQKKQLFNYSNRFERSKIRAIIYLTIDGRKPSAESTCNDEFVMSHLVQITYRSEILDWLESCLQLTRAEHMRRSLEQYIEFIKEIYGKAGDLKMCDEIIKKMIADKDAFNAARMIAEEINAPSIKKIWEDRVSKARLEIRLEEDRHVVFPIGSDKKYELWIFNDMGFGIMSTGKRRDSSESSITISLNRFGEDFDNLAKGKEYDQWEWYTMPKDLWVKYNLLCNGDFIENMENLAKEINEQITKQMKTE